jgi:hypothetical protein
MGVFIYTIAMDEAPVDHRVVIKCNKDKIQFMKKHAEINKAGSQPNFGNHFFGSSKTSGTPVFIQPKLTINDPNDEYEKEADAMADKVIRMQQPFVQAKPLPITSVQRKCAHCEEEEKKAQRKEMNGNSTTADHTLESYVGNLNGGGQLLSNEVRNFYEPRFGYDFSNVKVHTDSVAAKSAQSINALAYTSGNNIVFNGGQYSPNTDSGKRLLSHELTHIVQQGHKPAYSLQRACRSATQCTVPIAGNAGTFGATVEAESEAIAVASGGVVPPGGGPASCTLARHGQRATNFEALATGAGLGVTMAPGLAGFFINACLSPNDGANNAPCSTFPGGPPSGASPGQFCVQIHTTDEDRAITLRARSRPLRDADLRDFLWNVSAVKHESQHNIFDANPSAIASFAPPAGDCTLSTTIPIAASRTVDSLLSEISAEIAEFDVYFRNSVANPGRASTFAMQSEEHNIASRGGENILGNIRALQCACNCSTVDRFVEQVFNQASSGWSLAERREFKRAMTAFMPSFWPRSLHQR